MNICRTCLNNISDDLVPIFSKLGDQFIANFISDCSSVAIVEDDGLPAIICQECKETVQMIADFAAKVRESDRKLRQLFKSEVALWDIDECNGDDHEIDPFVTSLDLKLEFEVEKVEVQSESGAELEFDFEDGNDSDWNDDGQKMTDDEDDIGKENRKVGRKSKLKREANEERPKRRRAKKKAMRAEDDGDDAEEMFVPLNEKEQKLFEPIQIDPARHICCWCCMDFETKEQLTQHSFKHRNGRWRRDKVHKPHLCEICHRCFKWSKSLEDHMKMAAKLSSQTIYQCKRCPARFVAKKRRKWHMAHHESEDARGDKMEHKRKQKTRICCIRLCYKQFDTEEELLEHGQQEHIASKLEIVDPKQPHECPVCFKRFKSTKSLYHHRIRIYSSRTQCSICGKEFRSREAMMRHERMHNNERPYGCEICAKAFATTKNLKDHMLVHTEEKPFVCTVCGWSFKRECNLKIHMLIHSGVLPFKCEVCEKSFKGKYHLQYHMRTHTGAKPWKCQYCDKRFAHHANRTRHEISHTGVKPHTCSYCEKSFIRKRQLVEHESTHTGIQPFSCNLCNRLFGDKSEYHKHLESHPKASAQETGDFNDGV